MAASRIPWASIAVLLAFIAGTQLVPHAFDVLRPPEKDRAQAPVTKDLPVDARLWEDPFIAMRRYQAERDERCGKLGKSGEELQRCKGLRPVAKPSEGAAPDLLRASLLRRWMAAPASERTLVLAVMVPGHPFVGAEESRRRTRYAVLTGLMSAGYMPDDAEHMGLMSVDHRLLQSGTDAREIGGSIDQRYYVPFELLDAEAPDATSYRRVMLVWVDESGLPQPKLDALALLMEQLWGQWSCAKPKGGAPRADPELAVIGPSSTDGLRNALRDLDRAGDDPGRYQGLGLAARCRAADPAVERENAGRNELQQGYALLAGGRFLNAASTASERYLPELGGQQMAPFLTQKFDEVLHPQGTAGGSAATPVSFTRTIATDELLTRALVAEIKLRLPRGKPRRIVVVTERDSAYARGLLGDMRAGLEAQGRGERWRLKLEPAYYFRGIDGVTARDPAQPQTSAKPTADPALAIEWPEARDQLDYLRRLSDALVDSDADPGQPPIAAIGVVGFDVHDKLLVLQALHERFADRIFFTTDMDARFLHPRVLPFSRNLIVATSLPLQMQATRRESGGAGVEPPSAYFRDAYQSATYLAARQAACLSTACREHEAHDLRRRIARPLLYEIGRSEAVQLDSPVPRLLSGKADRGQGLIAGMLLALLMTALMFWPSTPSLRALRATMVAFDEDKNRRPIRKTAMLLASAHLLALVYVFCMMVAFLRQGAFVEKPWLAVLAYVLCGLALSPAVLVLARWLLKRLGRRPAPRPGRPLLSSAVYFLLVLVLCLCAVALVWRLQGVHEIGGETIAWFEGISAWPTELLHLAAVVAILWALDLSLDQVMNSLNEDTEWLAMPMLPKYASAWSWLRHVSVMRWRRAQGGSSDVAFLWREYRWRGAGRPRLARTAMSYVGTMIVALGLWWVFSGGNANIAGVLGGSRLIDLPVRGAYHQHLMLVTLALVVLLLPLSIVLVADATLLVYRFVIHLDQGRSFYPRATLLRFAQGLGDAGRAQLWCRTMQRLPHERTAENAADGLHTLLDDWIDMQMVARRTSRIAPLVIGPFVVLGILLLARSRVFDNWSMTPAVALAVCGYLALLILLSVLLKNAVENTRAHALEHMTADLRWLKGQKGPLAELATPFQGLIDEVKTMDGGAFAGLFDQPLLKAVLIPLGSAGGAQLLDYISLLK
ncbi:hypothetical protein [Pelomonas sp. KK5]|uniref:hypothetical protein n=1 Tax=Pelomonas sp. KK5 TaxID=1855730 RepID=UPI00097BF1FC|nr:hypothetical protein [Pelomonas sp. KK5]